MPSFFNLHEFKESYASEIEHLSEMFPQILSDNIALCLHENDCDFGLTVSRLAAESSIIPAENPKAAVKYRMHEVKATNSKPRNMVQSKKENVQENTTKSNRSIESTPQAESEAVSTSSLNVCVAVESEPETAECVIFDQGFISSARNVESPCVVFPFNVLSEITSIPISFL